MPNHRISVIIPIYNAEKTLPLAFNSVKEQTIGFDNIELLLVDDHSTDGSFALAQAWARQYANVHALQTEKNTGTAGAPRNLGVRRSSADYIMFLDNDDSFFPQACECLYNAVIAAQADYAQGLHFEVASNGEERKVDRGEEENGQRPGVHELDGTCRDIYNACIPYVWDKIFSKALISKYGIRFSEGWYGEDDAFSSLYVILSKRMVLTDIPIVRHTLHDASLSHVISSTGWWKGTVIKSILFMTQEAARMGIADRYDRIYGSLGRLDWLAGVLLDEPDEEGARWYAAWKPVFSYMYTHGFSRMTPETRILSWTAACGDDRQMRNVFLALREMRVRQSVKIGQLLDIQRETINAERQEQLDDIFGSTTWKIARALQKLKFWA